MFQKQLQKTCCTRTFRLVLTDIGMEPMNGLQVCEEIIATQKVWLPYMKEQKNILKFKSRRECPVVAVTAFVDESTMQDAK